MTTPTEPRWSDADREVVAEAIRTSEWDEGRLRVERAVDAVLDALTTAGWRPPNRRGGQPTGCTCPQVEVTPWPGYPAVEREFIPGQPDPRCPEHGEGSEG